MCWYMWSPTRTRPFLDGPRVIDDHPFNEWSLFGLEQALRAQGKVGEAEETAKTFETSWARSDIWIRSSRF